MQIIKKKKTRTTITENVYCQFVVTWFVKDVQKRFKNMLEAKNSATREGPTHKLKRTMWIIIKIYADESPELTTGSYPQQRKMHCLTQPSPQLCLDSLVSSNDFACVSVLFLCFCLLRKLFISFFLLFKYYSAALYWVAVYSSMSYLLVDSLVRFSSLVNNSHSRWRCANDNPETNSTK